MTSQQYQLNEVTMLYKMQYISLTTLRLFRPTITSVYRPIVNRVFQPCDIRYQFPRVISTNANNMESNNQDLELNKLFDVKGKVALVTGGGIEILNSQPEVEAR